MRGFFRKIFRHRNEPERRDPARYEKEKTIAQTGDARRRLTLAGNSKTHQEILYYLAQHDPDPKVRRAVARNPNTPVHAAQVLAADQNADVRLVLAHRLVKLLPGFSKDQHSQIYAFAVQALGTLALDEVIKIRLALSSALKDKAYTPPAVAGKLARDVEREVSEPILRFCTALSDEELMDIIKSHPAPWAVSAIAGRKSVSALVAKAIIGRDDRHAGKTLIENKGAVITKDLLVEIVNKARNYPEWQKPVALRKNLPPEIGKALAVFADDSVRAILENRPDFDKDTVDEISETFRRRLAFAGESAEAKIAPEKRVVKLEKQGRLNEDTIADAIAMRDHSLACAALARMARTNALTVDKIFALKTGKPIVALCWRAGLSMRLAFAVQQEIGHVQPKDLVYPRDGTDYPLSREEMLWQLEFFGIKGDLKRVKRN